MASIRANARKVVCIGRNYADHIKELSNTTPTTPLFFLKPPTAIHPPNSGPVLRPRGTTLHYEVELALIMRHRLSDLPPTAVTTALDAIGGYAVAIDMTARSIQDHAKRRGLPWTVAKGFDTFLPLSRLIPREKIPDPHAAELWLEVNGEVRQRDSTELMLFRVPRLLSEISRVMTLEEGDVVLTGTPKGVGSVREGDVMRAGVRVDGEEVEEGGVEVGVKDREGLFEFRDE